MSPSTTRRETAKPASPSAGAWLIAAGLAGVLFATCWPSFPVLTAVSAIALGATDATIARYRRSPALFGVVLLHAITYAALYSLFAGVVLQKSSIVGSVSPLIFVDLVLSAIVVLIAAKRVVVTLRDQLRLEL